MVRSETVGGVGIGAREPVEGFFWKACCGVMAAALAAIAVQARSGAVGHAGTGGATEAQLSRVEARLQQLEASTKLTGAAASADSTGLAERVEKMEAKLADVDELADWSEASRLGVARMLALKAKGFTPREEARLAATIVREAHAAKLDPILVASVISVESGFNNYAVSPVGAMGLMQLMPATAGWLSKDDVAPVAGNHLFDFEKNVHLGTQYLAALIQKFGSVDKALVAYNMGPAAARKALAGPRAKVLLAGYPGLVAKAKVKLVAAQKTPDSNHVVAAVEKKQRREQ
jgi:soluble lytic murein transglycosylase